ncbi:hypothetical protein FIA58_020630 [Flavobacterium jejuense]|uniref:Uncharacterized protein n=1 Tax=Flavobacterium jejuense TaxID=1544455 RepID=A0ABX0J1N5_9FLAO|nr:hypothetical protein [Flavobacterium jejuense]NHN28091.1 hypothetical protein [Flavobacterium jejuense]
MNDLNVLDIVENHLNNDIPEIKEYNLKGFHRIEGKVLYGYSIFDLTDTINNSLNYERDIDIIENHIYHVMPVFSSIAYSNIFIVKKNKVYYFNFINCEKFGSSLDDVIMFVNNQLVPKYRTETILNNLNNYSNFKMKINEDYPITQLRKDSCL